MQTHGDWVVSSDANLGTQKSPTFIQFGTQDIYESRHNAPGHCLFFRRRPDSYKPVLSGAGYTPLVDGFRCILSEHEHVHVTYLQLYQQLLRDWHLPRSPALQTLGRGSTLNGGLELGRSSNHMGVCFSWKKCHMSPSPASK